MANEIHISYAPDNDLYYRLFKLDTASETGWVWDTVATDFIDWDNADILNYDIALDDTVGASVTGHHTGLYFGTVPADADMDRGRYVALIYLQAGANPDVTDNLVGDGVFVWNGTTEEFVTDTYGGVDVRTWLGSTVNEDPAGYPSVNVTSIDGDNTNGHNATLRLKQLSINYGAANGNGLQIAGFGTGHGVEIVAGLTGDGVNIAAGGTSGDGVNISATDGNGIVSAAGGDHHGLSVVKSGTGKDFDAEETDTLLSRLGTPANIDTGGATIADNLKKIADDNAGTDFDATTDSLEKIGNRVDTVDTVVDDIKTITDALPNAGALTDIDTGVNNIEGKLPTNNIMGSSDVDNHDTDIDDILADTNELQTDDIPTKITAAESNIRGADADTLKTLSDQIDTLPSAGAGAIVVDHNTGGVNNLAYLTAGGVGIDNATVYAYLKADYDAGNLDIGTYVKAMTTTDVNGQWAKPMNLDAETYTMFFFRQPDMGPDVKNVVVA